MVRKVPPNDHRERMVCESCGYIHYENPKILVACIATWGDRVLWIKRATEPRKGYWAIPSGFAEKGETPEQAAARELEEETGARIKVESLNLFVVGSLPEISEVYLVYRGELDSDDYHMTAEAEAVALFSRDEAPWGQYAYPAVVEAMHQFYRDHLKRSYGVYVGRYADEKNTFTRIREHP